MHATRSISVSRFIAAPASKIFDLLADPRQHARFDGSGTVTKVKKSPERLFLGYATTNKVVVFEEDKSIAWHHVAQFVWRYDLEEVEGGTMVTESFNYDKPWAFAIIRTGFPERNRLAMGQTLERIERIVTA
jgi:hypothetical protein